MKQRGRRGCSILLTLCLLIGLSAGLAVPAGAEHWAQSAVDTLNGIYGSNVFSADDAEMTVSDAQSVLNALNNSTDVLDGQSSFTRGLACEVLADIFALPIGNQTAIQYLYNENIINGESSGNLNPDGSVSKAQFAVLSYRVLNAVGGGEGAENGWPTPGSEGYTAWMYLAVRKCVPFEMDQANETIGKVEGFKTYVGSAYNEDRYTIYGGTTAVYKVTTAEKSRKDIWDAWVSAMQDPNIGGSAAFADPGYDANETLLEAAIRIVQHTQSTNPVIFHDVNANNWFYDGIMYLVNNNIVIGYGDGKFGPDDITPRYELAVLLATADGTVLTTQSGPGRIIEAIQHAIQEGYMTGEVPTTTDEDPWNPETDSYWGMPATREEAAVGILKMIESTEKIDTSSDNTDILDRFTDRGRIQNPDSEPYLAYAVSMGLLSGTSSNTLEPDGMVSRAQVGVLLYRTLIGVDKTKMQDYRESVEYVLPADTGTAGTDSESTGAEGGN